MIGRRPVYHHTAHHLPASADQRPVALFSGDPCMSTSLDSWIMNTVCDCLTSICTFSKNTSTLDWLTAHPRERTTQHHAQVRTAVRVKLEQSSTTRKLVSTVRIKLGNISNTSRLNRHFSRTNKRLKNLKRRRYHQKGLTEFHKLANVVRRQALRTGRGSWWGLASRCPGAGYIASPVVDLPYRFCRAPSYLQRRGWRSDSCPNRGDGD